MPAQKICSDMKLLVLATDKVWANHTVLHGYHEELDKPTIALRLNHETMAA